MHGDLRISQVIPTILQVNKYYVTIPYQRFERNNETHQFEEKITYLQPELCNEENVYDPQFKKNRDLSKWYCIDFKKYNMVMGGFWGTDFVYYFRIHVSYCQDLSMKNKSNCRPFELIKKDLGKSNKLYFSILYPEFYFEPNNLHNPVKYQHKNYYNQITKNLIKTDRIYFKSVQFEDDKNLISTEYKKSNITAFDRFWDEQDLKTDEDYLNPLNSILFTNIIYFSKGGDKYIRSYMKLQDLAATVGGFMQLIFVFGKILCSQYNSYERNITLFNEIFDFEEESLYKQEKTDHALTVIKQGHENKIEPDKGINNLF